MSRLLLRVSQPFVRQLPREMDHRLLLANIVLWSLQIDERLVTLEKGPGLAPEEGSRQESIFTHGELFERILQTSKGPVGMLAEVVIVDKLLHLKDVVIYGQEQLSGLLRELLQAKTHLINQARAAGFETLRLSGQRVAGSSSANPGKVVDIIIDLTKRAGADDVY
jgi:hypothetical protein